MQRNDANSRKRERLPCENRVEAGRAGRRLVQ